MKISVINDGYFYIRRKNYVIRLSVCAYLLRYNSENILIDAGPGSAEAYNREKYGADIPRKLEFCLNSQGLTCGDINIVILTHLHFDHSDGIFDPEGVLLFKNAVHIVNSAEWQSFSNWADHGRIELYRQTDTSRFRFVERDLRINNSLIIRHSPGHTAGFQYVEATDDAGGLHIFPGDIIPTVWHLNNSSQHETEFDADLLKKNKEKIIQKAINTKATVYFQHSAYTKPSKLSFKSGKYSVGSV